MRFENLEIKDYSKVSDYLIKNKKSNIILLDGNMGSGKTTFIQTLCKNLGVLDNVLSPTFSLVNEYILKDNLLIYHFDLYRVKSVEELIEIGFDEYVYSKNICLIEWPEIAKEIIPNKNIRIKIEINEKLKRDITIFFN
jgi:tRNA threonylcarbamoyladenosine biosynthesis protein TsaE|tara:strand:+ start:47952 stop:48368 length:417 start_codon:yes stop_codon:yes gene_type:complete